MKHNPLCGQTVTLYHPDEAGGTVTRTVVQGVSWQRGRRRMPNAQGTREGSVLLLVIPETAARYGVDYTLAPGDRAVLGEGPDLPWEDWPDFIPAAGEAAILEYVTPFTLRGAPHHVEAGGWWTTAGTGAHSLTN